MAKEGIILELVSFANTRMPNQALNNGDIDLNAFQHHAYFNDEVKNNGYDIVPIADTFIVVMNIYSKKISNVSELKKGDKVGTVEIMDNEGLIVREEEVTVSEDIEKASLGQVIIENFLMIIRGKDTKRV